MTHDIVLRTPYPPKKKWQIGVAADKKLSKAPLEVPVSNWLLSRCWELVLPVVIILTSPFRKGLFGQQQQVRPLNQRTDKSATLSEIYSRGPRWTPAPVIFVCFQKCAHAINVDVYHLSTRVVHLWPFHPTWDPPFSVQATVGAKSWIQPRPEGARSFQVKTIQHFYLMCLMLNWDVRCISMYGIFTVPCTPRHPPALGLVSQRAARSRLNLW